MMLFMNYNNLSWDLGRQVIGHGDAARHKRYVMEDRWTAIRWAIGTARENDCVIIAGKGHEDFQEIVNDGEMARVGCKQFLLDSASCMSTVSKQARLRWDCLRALCEAASCSCSWVVRMFVAGLALCSTCIDL